MNRLKIYIAGPMSGIEDFNYPAFTDAETKLHAAGFAPINPAHHERLNPTGKPMPWDWYMRHAIEAVTRADGVALLDGWERSRGARLERRIATELGIPVGTLRGWVRGLA